MTDQPQHLAAYQGTRRTTKMDAVWKAIRTLDRRGAEINFSSVAAEAKVDRTWLYELDDIRQEITRLRAQDRNSPAATRPRNERPSEQSLRNRLAASLEANRRLRDENAALRRQLAEALGEAW